MKKNEPLVSQIYPLRKKLFKLIIDNPDAFCINSEFVPLAGWKMIPFDELSFETSLEDMKQKHLIKRLEYYYQEQVTLWYQRKYCLMMVSFGDECREKFFQGISPIAIAFNIVMFDRVFLFVEEPTKAERNIQRRIRKWCEKETGDAKQARLLLNSMEKLFPKAEGLEEMRKLVQEFEKIDQEQSNKEVLNEILEQNGSKQQQQKEQKQQPKEDKQKEQLQKKDQPSILQQTKDTIDQQKQHQIAESKPIKNNKQNKQRKRKNSKANVKSNEKVEASRNQKQQIAQILANKRMKYKEKMELSQQQDGCAMYQKQKVNVTEIMQKGDVAEGL